MNEPRICYVEMDMQIKKKQQNINRHHDLKDFVWILSGFFFNLNILNAVHNCKSNELWRCPKFLDNQDGCTNIITLFAGRSYTFLKFVLFWLEFLF